MKKRTLRPSKAKKRKAIVRRGEQVTVTLRAGQQVTFVIVEKGKGR